jgi:hypothetical protein
MGRQLTEEVDPELLENLDMLLNYDALQEEDKWPLMKEIPEEALEKISEEEDKK